MGSSICRIIATSVAFAGMLLGSRAEAGAQAPATSATLEVTVRSAENLAVLRGARVTIDALGLSGITSQSGTLRLTGIFPGTHLVEVEYLGYATTSEYLTFDGGELKRVQFNMPVRPVELSGIEVRAESDLLALRGFYDRAKGGLGTYLTRDDIQRDRPRYLSDVLRRTAGVRIGGSMIRPTVMIRNSGASCPVQFFVDGALTSRLHPDEVMPNDVEGMEIYRGSATIPPEYNKGTARCGVILIWTRID